MSDSSIHLNRSSDDGRIGNTKRSDYDRTHDPRSFNESGNRKLVYDPGGDGSNMKRSSTRDDRAGSNGNSSLLSSTNCSLGPLVKRFTRSLAQLAASLLLTYDFGQISGRHLGALETSAQTCPAYVHFLS